MYHYARLRGDRIIMGLHGAFREGRGGEGEGSRRSPPSTTNLTTGCCWQCVLLPHHTSTNSVSQDHKLRRIDPHLHKECAARGGHECLVVGWGGRPRQEDTAAPLCAPVVSAHRSPARRCRKSSYISSGQRGISAMGLAACSAALRRLTGDWLVA